MDPPELTNFGSLVRYALELETESATLYRTAAGLLRTGATSDFARELAEQHESRARLLQRTRQQTLNEMVLEPISGLDGTRYLFDSGITDRRDIRAKAIGIEEVAARLYADSSVIAKSLLTEAVRTFRKLADENRENVARIRGVLPA